MEKRAIIAITLSMVVFLLWGYFFGQKNPTKTAQSEKPVIAEDKAIDNGEVTKIERAGKVEEKDTINEDITESRQEETARDIKVKTKLYTAVFTERGGRLKSLKLHKYKTTAEKDSPPKEMVAVADENDYPLGLSFKVNSKMDIRYATYNTEQNDITLEEEGKKAELHFTYLNKEGLEIKKTFQFSSDSYLIGMKVRLRNLADKQFDDNLIVHLASEPISPKERYSGFGAFIDNDLLEIKPGDLEDDLEKLKKTDYSLVWAGYQDQYFMAALLPKEKDKTRVQAEPYHKKGVNIRFMNLPLVMPGNTQKEYDYQIFYGPKDYKILKEMNNGLERSIYFGWFDILSKPLLILMVWLYKFVGNYGIVIIIVTICIKIIFWPLTAKSYKSMKAMQKLQPKIMKLREKHKDNRQAMNEEMMQMYRTYKVNPLGGCLPMVIQIPVFIALYRLLDYSLELRHAPFMLWIQDLAAPDRLFQFGFKIPFMEPPSGIPVLTLLMGASMLIQQRMSPPPGDPTQAKIMMLMPIFFTFIFINFPAGLVLYWLMNNILSIGQQTLINKRPD